MGTIIDGKIEAQKQRNQIKLFIENKRRAGFRAPVLASITIGTDGGSLYYLNNQNKLCAELGVTADNYKFELGADPELIEGLINKLNVNNEIDGIMLQLPLPERYDEKKITNLISPNKDIDGLTDINAGKFYKGESCFVPCTARSVVALIKSTGIDLHGKNAVVIGRSNIVGKPTANLLLNENCTVTICHSKTVDLEKIAKTADILISAIGRPKFITSKFVKENAIVIDVGTTMIDGKVRGDVDFDDVKNKVSFVTPVPGGVGSMTTTILLQNLYEAYEKNVY